jgi:hypothetical protein
MGAIAHLRPRLSSSAWGSRVLDWRCSKVTRCAEGRVSGKNPAHYLALILCLLLLFSATDAIAQVVGSVTKVQKQAQVGATPATVGTPVSMNDAIRTGPEARLQITFRDGSLLTLGENARVVVNRYVYNPSASTGKLALTASQGALRFATGKLGEMSNKDVTVVTPQAALAVRGTNFWAGFVPGYYTYGVLTVSGTVEASNSTNSVTIPAGKGADLPPSLKAPKGFSEAYIWPEEKVKAALDTVAFAPVFPAAQAAAAAAAAAAAIGLSGGDDNPVSP